MKWLSSLVLAASLALAPGVAGAARPQTIYVPVDPPKGLASSEPPRVIFLNREQVTLIPGSEDPATNSSSIIGSTSTVNGWIYSDGSWLAFLQCMQNMFGRWNVTVTDHRPTTGNYVMV